MAQSIAQSVQKKMERKTPTSFVTAREAVLGGLMVGTPTGGGGSVCRWVVGRVGVGGLGIYPPPFDLSTKWVATYGVLGGVQTHHQSGEHSEPY